MGTPIVAVYGNIPPRIHQIYRILGAKVISIATLEQVNLSYTYTHLLLKGGADIHPHYYHQKVTYSQGMDPFRDRIEWAMVRKAVKQKLPILGICRGMQLLNIFFGGTLHQDIQAEGVSICEHQNTLHELDWRFTTSFPDECISRHHQCIAKIASKFTVLATSLDGIPEVIYKPGFCGIQAHPEEQGTAWKELFWWHLEGFLPD